MKKILYILLFNLIGINCFAQGPSIIPIGIGVQTDTNCNQAKYFTIGYLCQDTDDGKLYKGAEATVVEIAVGAVGGISSLMGQFLSGTSDNFVALRYSWCLD
jgi:hypothetical protein